MVREAQNAESKMDFMYKLVITQKECDESLYRLELLAAANYLKEEEKATLYARALKFYKS